jgi:hypothetical protein
MTDAELKARIAEAISKEPVPPTRSDMLVRNVAVGLVALALSLVIFEAWGGFRDHAHAHDVKELIAAGVPIDLSFGQMFLTFLGTLGITLAAWRVAWARSSSALGPPRQHLLAVVLFAPASLLVWRVGTSAINGDGLGFVWSRLGLKCFGLSAMIAAPVLLALLFGRRGSDPIQPVWTGAALGVTSGAAAAVFADLWCPIGNPVHVLLGHVLPMLLFAAIGALVGRRILEMR